MEERTQNVCPKCPHGVMTLYQYVREGSMRSNNSCHLCPHAEHLHVSCDNCGYTVVALTIDDTTGEDISQAKPVPLEIYNG